MSLDSTGEVAVDQNHKLKRINESAPLGVKLLLANRAAGVVTTGTLKAGGHPFFTHWAYCPVFEDDPE